MRRHEETCDTSRADVAKCRDNAAKFPDNATQCRDNAATLQGPPHYAETMLQRQATSRRCRGTLLQTVSKMRRRLRRCRRVSTRCCYGTRCRGDVAAGCSTEANVAAMSPRDGPSAMTLRQLRGALQHCPGSVRLRPRLLIAPCGPGSSRVRRGVSAQRATSRRLAACGAKAPAHCRRICPTVPPSLE